MSVLPGCGGSGGWGRLTFEERAEIARRHDRKEGVREIARALCRSPSTISRELRRNTSGSPRRWLEFLAAVCAMAAVCAAGWKVIVRSEWAAGAELGAGALGTLLITIGLLASAATNGSSPAAPVTGAVGIGIWALLVLSRAARTSLTEQEPPHGLTHTRQAELWLAAAIGLFVLAIGYGFTSAAGSQGPGIAAGLLQAIGVGALAGTVVAARSRQLLNSRPAPVVLAGLALLTVSFLGAAIVAGLALGTLAALAIGLTVVTAIELAAFVGLGLAAWTQVRAVYK